jgi:hypothetical protein
MVNWHRSNLNLGVVTFVEIVMVDSTTLKNTKKIFMISVQTGVRSAQPHILRTNGS